MHVYFLIITQNYKDAVQLYSKTITVLTAHSHVLSFKNIKVSIYTTHHATSMISKYWRASDFLSSISSSLSLHLSVQVYKRNLL